MAVLLFLGGSGVFLLARTTEAGAAATKNNGLTSPRQFYLTTSTFNGSQPLRACAAGYHFASFWEILDPSNLVYNTTLGYQNADSGFGPPTNVTGFIRSGFGASKPPACSSSTVSSRATSCSGPRPIPESVSQNSAEKAARPAAFSIVAVVALI